MPRPKRADGLTKDEVFKKKYYERKEAGLCCKCGKENPDAGVYVNCPNCRERTNILHTMEKEGRGIKKDGYQIFRKDTPAEKRERRRKQKIFRENVVAADKAGMSYGQYMAQKYMEEHNMAHRKAGE